MMNKLLKLISQAMDDTRNDIIEEVRDNLDSILNGVICLIVIAIFLVSFFISIAIMAKIGMPPIIAITLGAVFSLAVCYVSIHFLKNLAYYLACNLTSEESLEKIDFYRRNF